MWCDTSDWVIMYGYLRDCRRLIGGLIMEGSIYIYVCMYVPIYEVLVNQSKRCMHVGLGAGTFVHRPPPDGNSN